MTKAIFRFLFPANICKNCATGGHQHVYSTPLLTITCATKAVEICSGYNINALEIEQQINRETGGLTVTTKLTSFSRTSFGGTVKANDSLNSGAKV